MHQGCPWVISVLWLGCVGSVVNSAVPEDMANDLVPLPPRVERMPSTLPAASYALRTNQDEGFSDYLSDGQGRALYMLIDDIVARDESACSGTCAREWPAFDLDPGQPGVALDPALAGADLSRFHRPDGRWQLRYRGHPLYMRASELSEQGAITGDGAEGRWFVARDYLAFLARSAELAAGSFLTDGAGRTLYACLDDTPGRGLTEPSSACTGACLSARPPWSPGVALATRIPSSLEASAFALFERPDGVMQLSYRGWPIYYYREDVNPGDTAGHNQGAWRAIDPIAFGNNAML
jgi:predicted lipoprotein with Yx(FWY)xxD motif